MRCFIQTCLLFSFSPLSLLYCFSKWRVARRSITTFLNLIMYVVRNFKWLLNSLHIFAYVLHWSLRHTFYQVKMLLRRIKEFYVRFLDFWFSPLPSQISFKQLILISKRTIVIWELHIVSPHVPHTGSHIHWGQNVSIRARSLNRSGNVVR